MSARPSRKRSRKGGQHKNNHQPQDETLSSFWACPVCTLRNPLRRRRCGACESRRPVVTPEQHEEETTTTATTAVALESISTNASPVVANNHNNTTTEEEPQPPPKKRSKQAVATWLQKRRRRTSKSPEKAGADTNNKTASPTAKLIKVRIKLSKDDSSDCENLVGDVDDLDNRLLEASIPSDCISRIIMAPILGTHKPILDAQKVALDLPPLPPSSDSQTALPNMGDNGRDDEFGPNIVQICPCPGGDNPDSTEEKSSQNEATLLKTTAPLDFMHVQPKGQATIPESHNDASPTVPPDTVLNPIQVHCDKTEGDAIIDISSPPAPPSQTMETLTVQHHDENKQSPFKSVPPLGSNLHSPQQARESNMKTDVEQACASIDNKSPLDSEEANTTGYCPRSPQPTRELNMKTEVEQICASRANESPSLDSKEAETKVEANQTWAAAEKGSPLDPKSQEKFSVPSPRRTDTFADHVDLDLGENEHDSTTSLELSETPTFVADAVGDSTRHDVRSDLTKSDKSVRASHTRSSFPEARRSLHGAHIQSDEVKSNQSVTTSQVQSTPPEKRSTRAMERRVSEGSPGPDVSLDVEGALGARCAIRPTVTREPVDMRESPTRREGVRSVVLFSEQGNHKTLVDIPQRMGADKSKETELGPKTCDECLPLESAEAARLPLKQVSDFGPYRNMSPSTNSESPVCRTTDETNQSETTASTGLLVKSQAKTRDLKEASLSSKNDATVTADKSQNQQQKMLENLEQNGVPPPQQLDTGTGLALSRGFPADSPIGDEKRSETAESPSRQNPTCCSTTRNSSLKTPEGLSTTEVGSDLRTTPGLAGHTDTPSTKSWQPITQNAATVALAGKYSYTPGSQSEEYSYSQDTDTQSQDIQLTGLSPENSQSPTACAASATLGPTESNMKAKSRFASIGERLSPKQIAPTDSETFHPTPKESSSKSSPAARAENENNATRKKNSSTDYREQASSPASHGTTYDPVQSTGTGNCRNDSIPTVARGSDGSRTAQGDSSFPSMNGMSEWQDTGFSTAGKNKAICVDSAALSRAQSIFSKPLSVRNGTERKFAQTPPKLHLRSTEPLLPSPQGNFEMECDIVSRTSSTLQTTTNSKQSMTLEGKPISVSFRTAGTGKTIEADEEHLEKARELLSHGSNSRDTRTPLPLFQTAGRKQTVHVSEAGLKRARELLSSSLDPSKSQNGASQRFARTSLPCSHTAGKKQTVKASEAGLKRAQDILSGSSSASTSHQKGGIRAQGFKKPGLVCTSFLTAGKGSTVEVQSDDLERARKILGGSSGASLASPHSAIGSNARPRLPSGSFQTAGSKTKRPLSVPVSRGRSAAHVMPSVVNPSSTKPQLLQPLAAVFQTAGKGHVVEVSEENLENARRLLSEKSSYSTVPSCQPDEMNETIPGHSGTAARPSRVSFQTAGSGLVVEVSEENLENARRLLSEKSTSKGHGFQRNAVDNTTTWHNEIATRPSRVSFQTAGKGQVVEVSEESLENARRLLSGSDSGLQASVHQETGMATPMPVTSKPRPARVSLPPIGRRQSSEHSANRFLKQAPSLPSERSPPNSNGQSLQFTTGRRVQRPSFVQDRLGRMLPPRKCIEPGTQSSGNLPTVDSDLAASAFKTPGAIKRDSTCPARVTFPTEKTKDNIARSGQNLLRHRDFSLNGLDTECNKAQPGGASENVQLEDPFLQTPGCESVNHRPARLSFSTTTKPLRPGTKGSIDLGIGEVGETVEDDFYALLPNDRLSYHQPYSAGIGENAAKSSESDGCSPFAMDRHKADDTGIPQNEHSEASYEAERASDTMARPPQGLSEAVPRQAGVPRLLTMTESKERCIELGVSDILLSVDSQNGEKIAFDFAGLPTSLDSDGNGTEMRLRRMMDAKGLDSSKISSKWIRNHCRWISWKLASIERRFPRVVGTHYFTMSKLLEGLIGRFQKEIIDGFRSPLRKVLNRDISPSTMMILCVAKVDRVQKDSPAVDSSNNELDCFVELTDGWYSVLARLDHFLCEMVDCERIRVGTKLLVSNSSLHGAEGGIDPLDEEYKCSPDTSLRIFANSTRLARWDSKMGFLKMKSAMKETEGLLHIRSIGDIIEGGGRVPSIDFVVLKTYPLQFLHQSGDGRSKVMTEAEVEARRLEIDDLKAKIAEEVSGALQEECSKEVDESSPAAWKDMLRHPCPEDFLDGADEATKTSIHAWQEKRKHLIAERIRQELEARFEEHDLDETQSKPFFKLVIQDKDSSPDCQNQALLTVWGPSSEQLEILREKAVVRGRQLSVRSKFDGLLQVSANGRTVFLPAPVKPDEKEEEPLSQPSVCRGVFQTCVLSKRTEEGKCSVVSKIDLLGTVLCVKKLNNGSCWHTYLTDRSGMIMRVESAEAIFHGAQPSYSPLLLRSVRVESFDWTEHVGVATYTNVPSILSDDQTSSPAFQRLLHWLASKEGRRKVEQTLRYFNARLPPKQKMMSPQSVLLGYIVDFVVLDCKHLIVTIDCGEGDLLHLNLPLKLLGKIETDYSSAVVFGPSGERQALKLSRLENMFRARSLHHFLVREIDNVIPGHEECTHQIVELRAPDASELSAWYVNAVGKV